MRAYAGEAKPINEQAPPSHSMTSSRRTSRRVFAICGPVKRLNRSLPWEASGDDPRGQLVGMVDGCFRRTAAVESSRITLFIDYIKVLEILQNHVEIRFRQLILITGG